MATNGSMTSECLAFAAVKACSELLTKMQPARDELTDPTWEEVVTSAYKKGVNLQSTYMMSLNDDLKGICTLDHFSRSVIVTIISSDQFP